MSTLYRIVPLSAVAFAATLTPASAQPSEAAQAFKKAVLPQLHSLLSECSKFGWGLIALNILITVAITFLAAWLISRLLIPKTGTFFNTARYYVLDLLVTSLFLSTLAGLVWFAFTTEKFVFALAGFGLVLLIWAVFYIRIPMTVYKIGLLKAVFFSSLVGTAAGAGHKVLATVFPTPLDGIGKSAPDEQRKVVSQTPSKQLEKKSQPRPAPSSKAATTAQRRAPSK